MSVKLLSAIAAVGVFFCSCTNQKNYDTQAPGTDSSSTKTTTDMQSFLAIFEIPARDISRAVAFYEAVLDIRIEKMDMQGMQMGIFPYEGQMVTGVILKAEGYNPSADGVTIYLNGGDNLQVILDRVEPRGGKVLIPKTLHADENGYFAIFLDSEGNKLGLHSPH